MIRPQEITIRPGESTIFSCQSYNMVYWYNSNHELISIQRQLRVYRAGKENQIFECLTVDDEGNEVRAIATLYVRGN